MVAKSNAPQSLLVPHLIYWKSIKILEFLCKFPQSHKQDMHYNTAHICNIYRIYTAHICIIYRIYIGYIYIKAHQDSELLLFVLRLKELLFLICCSKLMADNGGPGSTRLLFKNRGSAWFCKYMILTFCNRSTLGVCLRSL